MALRAVEPFSAWYEFLGKFSHVLVEEETSSPSNETYSRASGWILGRLGCVYCRLALLAASMDEARFFDILDLFEGLTTWLMLRERKRWRGEGV